MLWSTSDTANNWERRRGRQGGRETARGDKMRGETQRGTHPLMKPKNTRTFLLALHSTSSTLSPSVLVLILPHQPAPPFLPWSHAIRLPGSMTIKGQMFPPFIYWNPPSASICSHKGADEALMERLKDGGRWSSSGTMYVCVCIHECVTAGHTSCMLHLMGNDDTHIHRDRGVTMLSLKQTEQFEVCLLGLSVCSEEASVEDLKLCVWRVVPPSLWGPVLDLESEDIVGGEDILFFLSLSQSKCWAECTVFGTYLQKQRLSCRQPLMDVWEPALLKDVPPTLMLVTGTS